MSAGVLFELKDFSAGYGRRSAPVVRNLGLRVDAGEVVCLLGPNGAGKTTTLLAASGLATVLHGSVSLDGHPLQGKAAHTVARAGLGHVLENRGLFSDMTVLENLKLGSYRGSADVGQVVERFPPLESLLQRKVGLLSGGEQQMLALGRALVAQPRLLLIDELSLGLAPAIVEALLPMIRQLAMDTGIGVLLVEQHVDLALEVAHRGYVLSHGELVLSGPASGLLSDEELLKSAYLGETAISDRATAGPGPGPESGRKEGMTG